MRYLPWQIGVICRSTNQWEGLHSFSPAIMKNYVLKSSKVTEKHSWSQMVFILSETKTDSRFWIVAAAEPWENAFWKWQSLLHRAAGMESASYLQLGCSRTPFFYLNVSLLQTRMTNSLSPLYFNFMRQKPHIEFLCLLHTCLMLSGLKRHGAILGGDRFSRTGIDYITLIHITSRLVPYKNHHM